MPPTPHPDDPPHRPNGAGGPPGGPRRRTVLFSAAGAATGAVLTGCTDDGTHKSRATARHPSAAERSRARAARESGALGARYDAVLAAHPALGPLLVPLRAEVARHVTAFGGASSRPSPAPSGTPATPASGAPRPGSGTKEPSDRASQAPPAVPASETDALRMLASAEHTLAGRRAEELLNVPGELARLLASVAAAGAAHAYLLTEGAGKG